MTYVARLSFAIVLLLSVRTGAIAQQFADPEFDATVDRPVFTGSHPLVLLDEAHNNFHTAGGRYKPFAVSQATRDQVGQLADNLEKLRALHVNNNAGKPGIDQFSSLRRLNNSPAPRPFSAPMAVNPAFPARSTSRCRCRTCRPRCPSAEAC